MLARRSSGSAGEVEDLACRLLDVLDGVVEQRERAEAEEVHLQETDAIDLLHRPLRGDFPVVLLTAVERHEFGQRPRRDHDAGGVDGGMTRHAFEALGHIEQLVHAGIALVEIGKRGASRSATSSVMSSWLGISLATRSTSEIGISMTRPTSRTTALGLHRAERDDLRDVLPAVFLGDVRNHLAAPALAEVDVDIGQRHALGVQEALEVQIEMQRIDVRDFQGVRDETARRRAAARADGNSLVASVADEVPHDQEVPGVFHPLDEVDLVREPRFVLGDGPAQIAACRQLLRAWRGGSAKPSRTTDSK